MSERLGLSDATGSLSPGPAPAEALRRFRALAARHHPDALDFELSTGYLLQATRHGFGAAVAPETVTVHSRDPETGRPVVVASAGAHRAAHIAAVARRLFDQARRPVVVKNVSPALARELTARGLRPYRPGEGWRGWARQDDNTFPEQILDTAGLTALGGRRHRRLRHERNRLARRAAPALRPAGAVDPEGQDGLLAAWAARLGARTGLPPAELAAAVRVLLARAPDLVHYEARDGGGRLVARFVFSPISRRCLAFNALLNDPGLPGSFRGFVLAAARVARQLRYAFLNVQGSEDHAQHLSKRRLRPVLELPKTHLVFDGADRGRPE